MRWHTVDMCSMLKYIENGVSVVVVTGAEAGNQMGVAIYETMNDYF